jgi:hypothetical protein
MTSGQLFGMILNDRESVVENDVVDVGIKFCAIIFTIHGLGDRA